MSVRQERWRPLTMARLPGAGFGRSRSERRRKRIQFERTEYTCDTRK